MISNDSLNDLTTVPVVNIKQFVHRQYNVNSYLLYSNFDKRAYLIDAGAYLEMREFIFSNEFKILKLFLTHGHYDHILGVELLVNDFPECEIVAHPHAVKCLYDSKLNLSFYKQNELIVNHAHCKEAEDRSIIKLFQGVELKIIFTPGHNPGSLSFLVDDYLFTGDAYIPSQPLVTKLPGGNRLEAENSVQLIKSMINQKTILAPGHGPVCASNQLVLMG